MRNTGRVVALVREPIGRPQRWHNQSEGGGRLTGIRRLLHERNRNPAVQHGIEQAAGSVIQLLGKRGQLSGRLHPLCGGDGQLSRRVEGKLRRHRRADCCFTKSHGSAVELRHGLVQPARCEGQLTCCPDGTLCRQSLRGLDDTAAGVDQMERGGNGPPRAAERTSPRPAPVSIRSA